MKAVVAAFNQEKALVGAFSVITNLQMEIFEALVSGVPRLEQSILAAPVGDVVVVDIVTLLLNLHLDLLSVLGDGYNQN